MRIALVIERFDPAVGGAERSTTEIARELAQRGHTVTILAGSARYGSEFEVEDIEIERFSRRRSSSLFRLFGFARWAKRWLAAGDFDVGVSMSMAVPAHVLQPRGGTIRETLERNIAMRPTASARLRKRIATLLNPKPQLALAYEARTVNDPLVRKIVALSAYVKEQLQRHYHVPDDRIEVIPNAAMVPTVSDTQKRRWKRDVRSGFNVAPGSTLFLFAAQNPRLKGFDTLVRSLNLLQQRGQDVTVLLAGDYGHGEKSLVANLGVRGMVRFVGQTRNMPALYAAADVTVHPTFYDPASKVVIESLMLGTPAISTRYNGASDHIEAVNGKPHKPRGRIIADPADAEALAEAMADLTTPTRRRQCAKATVGLADSLSMTRHVDRLEALLAEVTHQ